MIESKGFCIHFSGDSSVGIPDSTWNLEGNFSFEEESDFKSFKEKIKEAFEYCSDTPISIMTYEEIKEQEKWLEEAAVVAYCLICGGDVFAGEEACSNCGEKIDLE